LTRACGLFFSVAGKAIAALICDHTPCPTNLKTIAIKMMVQWKLGENVRGAPAHDK
jgi:hypothetical protein